MKPRVLLIDDDAQFTEDLRLHLEGNYELETLLSGEQALDAIKTFNPDVALLDIDLGRAPDGFEILSQMKTEYPEIPVVMVTRHDTAQMAVRALRLGAFDYIEKGAPLQQLAAHIERAIGEATLWRENRRLKEELARKSGRIVGESAAMCSLMDQIDRVAETSSTVLITGETGTGKGVVAREIHDRSSRRQKHMVSVCCPAIPESLVESELFGHERGAFTGATSRRIGKFEQAHNGTIFLDEISEIPLEIQAKLLKVLEDGRVTRVGGIKEVDFDVRVIAATNRDLAEQVSQGRFRQDLFYRLRVIPLHIPPLRERREDIPLLVQAILGRKTTDMNRAPCRLSKEAMDRLVAWDWPGNIRELENVLEYALVHSRVNQLSEEAFVGLVGPGLARMTFTEARARALEKFEIDYLELMLRECNGNKSEAARRMGLTREGLRKLLKKRGL